MRIELLEGRAPGDGGIVREFELTVVRAGGLGRLVAEGFVPGLVGRSGLVPATLPGFVRRGLDGTSVVRCRIDAGTADGEIEGVRELGSLTTSFDVLAPGGRDNTSACSERTRGLAPGTVRWPGTGRFSGSFQELPFVLASLLMVVPAGSPPGLTSRSVNWRCCANTRTRLEPSTRSFRWLFPTETSAW